MYEYGDLIKIDLTVQGSYYESYRGRWIECPYVIVYNTQVMPDIIRIEADVHYPDGSIVTSAMVKANPLNSKLIERMSDD